MFFAAAKSGSSAWAVRLCATDVSAQKRTTMISKFFIWKMGIDFLTGL
jgi:hypothetical protein